MWFSTTAWISCKGAITTEPLLGASRASVRSFASNFSAPWPVGAGHFLIKPVGASARLSVGGRSGDLGFVTLGVLIDSGAGGSSANCPGSRRQHRERQYLQGPIRSDPGGLETSSSLRITLLQLHELSS